MGAFDQFKDQANEYEEQAKNALGNKRDKSANPQRPERMERTERGAQRDAQERGSEVEDRGRERMDRDAEEEQDWA
jgi:hypothetical protein